ncbi:hypothetical protein CDAR_380901 [Caerostris darwini]|uniref:Uncharacterized protein n=1 Tax=Caerostris darwini TaxID=1538125 RepID=A0AAV4S2M7_9ARAC|nr:hypothetical protein CDAR_380901 [Caerostris darwini]
MIRCGQLRFCSIVRFSQQVVDTSFIPQVRSITASALEEYGDRKPCIQGLIPKRSCSSENLDRTEIFQVGCHCLKKQNNKQLELGREDDRKSHRNGFVLEDCLIPSINQSAVPLAY